MFVGCLTKTSIKMRVDRWIPGCSGKKTREHSTYIIYTAVVACTAANHVMAFLLQTKMRVILQTQFLQGETNGACQCCRAGVLMS